MLKSIFRRWLGDPGAAQEPAFTQALASVLEHDEGLARELGEWLIGDSAIGDCAVEVATEVSIPGGRLDLVIEYEKDSRVVASLFIENKLFALPTNNWPAYMQEVEKRRQYGEHCVLLLVTRRYAKADPQIQPLLSSPDFRYASWDEVYRLISNYLAAHGGHALTREFREYLEVMGMSTDNQFTMGEIGLAAYYPSLLDKLERILTDQELDRALAALSCKTRSQVSKDWKNGQAFAHYTYVKPNSSYYVAAGFAYPFSPYWRGFFGAHPLPIVAFVGLGSEGCRDPGELRKLIDWAKANAAKRNVHIDSAIWQESLDGPEFGLVTWTPLTAFMPLGKSGPCGPSTPEGCGDSEAGSPDRTVSRVGGENDHLYSCRRWLLGKLEQIGYMVREV